MAFRPNRRAESSRAPFGSGGEGLKRCVRLGVRCLGVDHQLVGGNEVDIGDADEAKDMPQVAAGKVDLGSDLSSARGNGDDSALAGQQALGPGLGITEGDSGAGDLVDPGLERGRNAEIVYR